MKKYIFIAMAAVMTAACTNKKNVLAHGLILA